MLFRKRLLKEMKDNEKGFKEFYIKPINDKFSIWHFTMKGPEDTPYSKGYYHGYFTIPDDYPMSPPDLYFLTKNGRYETNKKICLTITSYHKETWSPAWNFQTMMRAIRSYFIVEDSGIGSIKRGKEEREELAKKSHDFKCSQCGSVSQIVKLKIEKS